MHQYLQKCFKHVSRLKKTTMDALFHQAVRDCNASRKTSFPWTRDQPYPQPYYTFTSDKWCPAEPNTATTAPTSLPTKISLMSWNIDFMLPYPTERMTAALSHLHSLIEPTHPTTLSVIFLQEALASDLTLLQSTPWVRSLFHLTDLTPEYWESGHYGTVTLIDRRLPITSVFRTHYTHTKMERDGLFVDVSLPSTRTLRLCNSHLESLIADPPLRPKQVELATKFMHDPSVHAALIAGDFNAIQPFDASLHTDNGLSDAFLSLGGEEGSDEGYTWGQQAATRLRDQFGCSRMDKVFFCGGVEIQAFERFGADVCVEDEGQRETLVALGLDKPWVTDHLGVKVDFVLK